MENTPTHQVATEHTSFSFLGRRGFCVHSFSLKHAVLLVFTVLLLLGSFVVSFQDTEAYAASPGAGYTCSWHRVVSGDTLGHIATAYHTTIWNLARINTIRNVNLIFVGQNLCIAQPVRHSTPATGGSGGPGLLTNGSVHWYAYNALQWSTPTQVMVLLRQAAVHYGLPVNLLMAIAWQESGWTQHVISRDGGIGTMQIMPYTAYGLDIQTHTRYDPYQLADNIQLGAIYLRSLMNGFHGNTTLVISAYNEGGWNVVHRGVFNWRYVNSVRTLMRHF